MQMGLQAQAGNGVRLEAIPRIDGHPDEIAHPIAADTILGYLTGQPWIDLAGRPRRFGGQTTEHWNRMAGRLDQPMNDGLNPDHKKAALGTATGEGQAGKEK